MVWEGYEMEIGNFQGHEYGIVFPGEMAEGRPYVWRVEFFGAFPAVDLAMLKKGYAVVYYRISDLYGSEEAVRRMAAFQPMVEEKYRLASQAVLFGFSRGGLYALHYAAKYPERAASLYLDAPVVDIYSWPGGFGLSEGAAAEWEECRALWDRTRDEYRRIVDSAIRTLLTWGVPLIMVAGGKDEVVPYAENGAILQAAYEKSSVPFRVIIKPECGHHPHSLDDPDPVAGFLEENRVFPTEGNAFRINDQPAGRHPLVLLVHDSAHAGIAAEAEKIFSGRLAFGYVGTSPWPGTMTNQRTLAYSDPLNESLYDFLWAQMETGYILYGQNADGEEDAGEIPVFIRQVKEKCPVLRQIWLKQKSEGLPAHFLSALKESTVELVEYGSEQELSAWLENLAQEVLRGRTSARRDSFDREWAEWMNLSVTLPRRKTENRILLVGDSISAGYGEMVQRRMPGFYVDRLNTSEGIHHPNFLRLLEIALRQYPYRLVHINNGIHLHGQDVKEYGKNLQRVLFWIHLVSPETKIVFAATTPLSRRLGKEEMEKQDIGHFSMGDRAPLAADREDGYWVTDEKGSEIYRALNDKAKEICAAYDIPFNDLYGLCVGKNLQKSDGVHFTQEGYVELAEKTADMLRRELSGGK